MVKWRVILTKQATKDAKKLTSAGLKLKAQSLLTVLEENPYSAYPPYEKLLGNLDGYYSRRINIQHRLIYQVLEVEKIVKVIAMWTHYE